MSSEPQSIEQAGLGKNDYIPLLIAVFVDFCLLLVSISRPMNRFTALTDRMHQAQDWPVIEILSKFHGIHQDPAIRQTFEVLRHVVFDWRGVYYAAIPLNGGENTDGKQTSKEQELEAYLLNNLFTSFERERIFRPVPVSMFTTAYIQKKLRQQRSKYAECRCLPHLQVQRRRVAGNDPRCHHGRGQAGRSL